MGNKSSTVKKTKCTACHPPNDGHETATPMRATSSNESDVTQSLPPLSPSVSSDIDDDCAPNVNLHIEKPIIDTKQAYLHLIRSNSSINAGTVNSAKTNISLQLTDAANASWLICDERNNLKLLPSTEHQPLSPSTRWTPLPPSTNKTHSTVSMPWSYYHDCTMSRLKNPVLSFKPNSNYFIVAQLQKSFLSKPLQQSLLSNVHALSADEEVKFDLYDTTTQNYLFSKSLTFGKEPTISEYLTLTAMDDYGANTPPIYYCQHLAYDNEESYCSSDSDLMSTPKFLPYNSNPYAQLPPLSINIGTPRSQFKYDQEVSPMAIPSPSNRHKAKRQQLQQQMQASSSQLCAQIEFIETPRTQSELDKKSFRARLGYDDAVNCVTYAVDDEGGALQGKRRLNTAFVHHLLDPHKNLYDHHLWIPTVFNAQTERMSEVIQSAIPGLDFVKFKSLYLDIAAVFKTMQSMFENVLNRKLGCAENVIVALKQYVVQKHGDVVDEKSHQIGMGENIECVGAYYVDGNVDGDGMQLSLVRNNKNFECVHADVPMASGDVCVFRNEAFQKFSKIENKGSCIRYRTVLWFYVLSQDAHIMNANRKKLHVNLTLNWKYIVHHWLRCENVRSLFNLNHEWMLQLVYVYLVGHNHDEYVYNRRQKMVSEKKKVEIEPHEVKQKHFTQIMPIYQHQFIHDDDEDEEEEDDECM